MTTEDATAAGIESHTATGPGCTVTLGVPRRTCQLTSAILGLLIASVLLIVYQSVDCRSRWAPTQRTALREVNLGFTRHLAAGTASVVDGMVPTGEELVQIWIHRGAAMGEGVLRSDREVAQTLGQLVPAGANLTAEVAAKATSLRKRARVTDDILREPHGVVLSSARHSAWLGDCVPFVKALNASERRFPTVAPIEFRPKASHPLGRQVASVVSAALAAVALGRPFRAGVAGSFGKGYIRANLFNWKVHREHYDLVKESRPHIQFDSVRELLHTGGAMTNGLTPEQAAEFSKQTLLLERAELPPEELLPVLTRRLSRFGGQTPIEMEQAVMCTSLALFRPSPTTMLRIEELLETAAEEQGAGLLIGIAPGQNEDEPQGLSQLLSRHLECAWRLSTNFVSQGGKGGAAWVIVNELDGDTTWSVAAQKHAASYISDAQRKVADTRVHVLPVDTVKAPVDLDSAVFREWVSYFMLQETHVCTPTQSITGMLGCAGSIRHFHVAQDRMMKVEQCV